MSDLRTNEVCKKYCKILPDYLTKNRNIGYENVLIKENVHFVTQKKVIQNIY